MQYLGIDPSQRHTGLALLDDAGQILALREIQPQPADLLSCGGETASLIETYCHEWFGLIPSVEAPNCITISMEKQVLGGQSSALLIYMQMRATEALQDSCPLGFNWVNPLPVQLKSYIIHTFGRIGKHKSDVVKMFHEVSGVKERTSSHKADAYFLARLARDVMKGTFRYNLPQNEQPLFPWSVINGDNLPTAKGTNGPDEHSPEGP